MQILSPESYASIVPLVKASGMRGHLALVYEVLEKRMPGRVFVDAPANPRAAVVCNSNGFTFAFGEPDKASAGPQIEALLMENRRDIYATIFGSNMAWEPLLRETLSPFGAHRVSRVSYELFDFPPMPEAPPGFRIEPIDARLAQSIEDGTGTGDYGIDPWFIRIAGGPQKYEAMGMGLALTVDNQHPDKQIDARQIAAIAGICGLSHEEAELEVGTTPAYRGRGLATVVTAAFMHQCRERGLLPAYSTDSENVASMGVARKLGYAPIEEIHGYHLFL